MRNNPKSNKIATTFKSSDPIEALKMTRLKSETFRPFRHVVLEPERTIVYDINGDTMTIEGLGWKSDGVARLVNGLGASFNPSRVNEAPLKGDTKEFAIVKGDPSYHIRFLG